MLWGCGRMQSCKLQGCRMKSGNETRLMFVCCILFSRASFIDVICSDFRTSTTSCYRDPVLKIHTAFASIFSCHYTAIETYDTPCENVSSGHVWAAKAQIRLHIPSWDFPVRLQNHLTSHMCDVKWFCKRTGWLQSPVTKYFSHNPVW